MNLDETGKHTHTRLLMMFMFCVVHKSAYSLFNVSIQNQNKFDDNSLLDRRDYLKKTLNVFEGVRIHT